MSPEQASGKPLDARSDIFSFGVVLYEALCGRRPFAGVSDRETLQKVMHEIPPAPPQDLPGGVRALLEKALEKDPAERYQSMSDLVIDMRRVARAEQTPAPGPRRRLILVSAGAVVLALAAAGVIFLRPGTPTAGGRRTSTGAPASPNQQANDAFELAMQFGRVQNDVPRSMQMLERALALDPHFAEARRHHAFNYLVSILNGYSNDASLLYKAEEELRQASQENPNLPSLPSAFTAAYLMQGRWELVPTAALDRIIQNDPSNRDTIVWRAIVHDFREENSAAKTLLNRALEREPLFGAPRMFLGEILRTEGDIQGAFREQQRVLLQAPGNITAVRFLVLAYLDAGELDKARDLLEAKRPEFAGNYMWKSTYALLLAREGKRKEALALMDEQTLKFLSAAFVATLDAAESYALLGDASKAIEWLDRAVRNGDERIGWFRRNPRLGAIRQDPRFQGIIGAVEARRSQRRP
jgi:Flp pilus assembly protein TadD